MTERICEGQVALVTGASAGGTGTAIAIRLAAEGARVAVTARTVSGLEETRRRIEAIGGECLVLPADLSRPDGGRRELVSQTEAELGPIDILVNNANAHIPGLLVPFEETTEEKLHECLQVNFLTPWELMKKVVPGMRERGRGWVVNLSSQAAELLPGPPFSKLGNRQVNYGTTKAAQNRLTAVVAGECEGQGIAVNALAPLRIIATPAIVAGGVPNDAPSASIQLLYEPLETMAEAALALCTGNPAVLTGRIAYSLQLLLELERPVYDLHGEHLLEGWQPNDLPALIASQEEIYAEHGWPVTFGRVDHPAS
jgi:NAD(P)-dependent dehydrogenase (short-subunit alcohol dehydrogenase family)